MNVALLLWNDVDLRSLLGPGRIFARAGDGCAFFVYTVAEAALPVASGDVLTIVPEYTIHDCPRPDLVVVPGGGSYYVAHRTSWRRWLCEIAETARAILAVADGVDLLRACGLAEPPGSTDAGGTVAVEHRTTRGGTILTTASAVSAAWAARSLVARLAAEQPARGDARRTESET